MFHFLKARKESKAPSSNYLFYGTGIVDVTNFDAMSPDDSLGYMCGCNISVSRNGQIEIHSDDSTEELLESFSVLNIVRANNNINNFDPNHTTEVSIMTESKGLRITFRTQESKNEFWNALTITYDKLKEST